MPAVIADTSVLISLAAGETFSFLQKLYGTVIIPQQVLKEISVTGKKYGAPEAILALSQGWLRVESCTLDDRIASFASRLDQGEIEALALALQKPGSLLLLDEAQGRRAAKLLGLAHTGNRWCARARQAGGFGG